jgi:hypothetical protein
VSTKPARMSSPGEPVNFTDGFSGGDWYLLVVAMVVVGQKGQIPLEILNPLKIHI